MVEHDPAACAQSVGFAVVHRDPVRIGSRRGIGAARVERRGCGLRRFLHQAIHLAGGGLAEAGAVFQAEDADRLEQAQSAQTIRIGGIFGRLEADLHMVLRGEIVDLVRLNLLHYADDVGGIGDIAEMQVHLRILAMRVFVDVFDPASVEGRRPALNPREPHIPFPAAGARETNRPVR